jgi:O-antigen ligase
MWAGYAIAALIAAAWGVLQYLGYDARPEESFRAQGPFKDPNVFGPFLVPIALWCIELAFERRGWARAIALVLLVTALFGVLISFSRGAWLNLFCAAATYVVLRVLAVRSSRSRLRMLATGFTVLALCIGLVTVTARSERFTDQFVERARLIQQYDVAATGRFAAQVRALRSAATHPLGVGPGRSAQEFGLEPHNLYLHVLSEGGWIAGLAFWSFLALTLAKSLPLLRQPWSFRSEAQIAFAAIAGILLQSFFIDSTHWRHLYLLLGVLWGLIVVRSRDLAYNSP